MLILQALGPGQMAGWATLEIVLRWIHIVAAIIWIGLLYFFNLVNFPLMQELTPATRLQVAPALLRRSMFWFRWSALVTVLAGMWYWMRIVGSDVRNAIALKQAGDLSSAHAGFAWPVTSFFVIWTVAWVIGYLVIAVVKMKNTLAVTLIYLLLVGVGAYLYVWLNNNGWESNRLLAIGIGGGIGWMLLLNVWGIVWRHAKRIIAAMSQAAASGTSLPETLPQRMLQVQLVSRASFWLTFPLIFFMAAASHFPLWR